MAFSKLILFNIYRGPSGRCTLRSHLHKKLCFFMFFFVIVTFVRNAHNLFVLPFVVFCFDGSRLFFMSFSTFYIIGWSKKSKK